MKEAPRAQHTLNPPLTQLYVFFLITLDIEMFFVLNLHAKRFSLSFAHISHMSSQYCVHRIRNEYA